MSVLSKQTIQRLRKIEKFILSEPKRFNMLEGVEVSEDTAGQLEQPPCGTACCIAGAAYIVGNDIKPLRTFIDWQTVRAFASSYLSLESYRQRTKLFYVSEWPQFYKALYNDAKTAKERAFIGVARIERFIATNGTE